MRASSGNIYADGIDKGNRSELCFGIQQLVTFRLDCVKRVCTMVSEVAAV